MTETSHTVATLRAALADLPDDLPIILSSDAEGNSYGNLWDVYPTKFAHSDGEIWTVHEDDVGEYDPENIFDGIGLWP